MCGSGLVFPRFHNVPKAPREENRPHSGVDHKSKESRQREATYISLEAFHLYKLLNRYYSIIEFIDTLAICICATPDVSISYVLKKISKPLVNIKQVRSAPYKFVYGCPDMIPLNTSQKGGNSQRWWGRRIKGDASLHREWRRRAKTCSKTVRHYYKNWFPLRNRPGKAIRHSKDGKGLSINWWAINGQACSLS